MADAAHAHHDHTSHYIKIWGILLVLLALSVLGPMAEIWWLTLITAFGIATVKASMVIKYFMHVDTELRMVWYILAGAVILMVLFFFGTAADVLNHEGSRWENIAAKAAVERGLAAGDGHGAHGEAAHGDAAPAGEHEAPAGEHH